MMKYKLLGNTGLHVSCLSYGAQNFGGGDHPLYGLLGGIQEKDAQKIVGTLLDNGVNMIDTADVYANGEAEIILGKALGQRRPEILLSTKASNRTGPGTNEVGQSRVHLMRALEASLHRLQTDYIDLYTLHTFDPFTRLDDCLRTLDDMVRQGKVRYIVCSNFAAWQVATALGISALQQLEPFAAVQAYYSLAGRDIEREIVPMANEHKLGIIAWCVLAGGFLTGKFTRTNAPDDKSRRLRFNFPPIELERGYRIIDVAGPIAQRHEASIAQICLAWALSKPFITSALFGARSIEQVFENLRATEIALESEDLASLDEASELRREYPAWLQGLPLGRLPGGTRDWSSVLK